MSQAEPGGARLGVEGDGSWAPGVNTSDRKLGSAMQLASGWSNRMSEANALRTHLLEHPQVPPLSQFRKMAFLNHRKVLSSYWQINATSGYGMLCRDSA